MKDCRIGLGSNCYCSAEAGSTSALQSKSAVLLLAHGSPETADEIPDFLQSITRGRPLPSQVIDEVTHRYSLIGFSPLTCWTRLQAAHLSKFLDCPVYVGMRNWKPYIADVVKQIASEGHDRVVSICLAPQNSRTSVGLYRSAVVGDSGLSFTLDFVESWHDNPLLARAFAEKFNAGWTKAVCRRR
jgi:ferrochelatase